LRGLSGGPPLAVRPRYCSNNADAVKAVCLAGGGIGLLPAYCVADELKDGRLEPVLEGFEPPPLNLYALLPEHGHNPARARTFIDFLAKRFASRPPGGGV
jgi:DNA-binding transcriptional LysR family regulator